RERNVTGVQTCALPISDIYMDMVSVGATINIMFAASMAEGTTTIRNAAKEPQRVDIANLLNAMGGKVVGAGTDTIKITGVKKLRSEERREGKEGSWIAT